MVRPSDPPDPSHFIALSLMPPAWWRAAAEGLRGGQRAKDVLARLAADRPRAVDAADLAREAAGALARGAAHGLAPVCWGDAAYPAALAAIPDPPFVLWRRGRAAALDAPSVALVGSRAASAHGLAIATRLAADLAAAGVTVVSGLARGIDAAAHRGALEGGGATVGVCGCGADVVYPREHAALVRAIEETGAIVSELAPGTPPQPQFFPLRNRIISGLSRAVVIVEAGEKSGSLITARAALEQGRDVLAVPGLVLGGRNRGAHALLRDGAKIVETADDILEEVHVPLDAARGGKEPRRGGGTSEDQGLLACLAPGEACDLDAIAERSGLAPPRLLPRLLALELAGRVRRAGGGRFVRVDSSC